MSHYEGLITRGSSPVHLLVHQDPFRVGRFLGTAARQIINPNEQAYLANLQQTSGKKSDSDVERINIDKDASQRGHYNWRSG